MELRTFALRNCNEQRNAPCLHDHACINHACIHVSVDLTFNLSEPLLFHSPLFNWPRPFFSIIEKCHTCSCSATANLVAELRGRRGNLLPFANKRNILRRGEEDASRDGGGNSGCLSNQDAYLGDGCCAGTCGDTYTHCYDCPATSDQDPLNYGGPSCFREGACIAEEPQGSCPAPADKRDHGTGTEYAGWCVCPGGSFCHGGACAADAAAAAGVALSPRDRWDPDAVSYKSFV